MLLYEVQLQMDAELLNNLWNCNGYNHCETFENILCTWNHFKDYDSSQVHNMLKYYKTIVPLKKLIPEQIFDLQVIDI